MSVFTHAIVRCDHLDKDAPIGQQTCRETVEEGSTMAEARRAAKAAGWTVNVHANSTRPFTIRGVTGGGWDYCPAHKPSGEGQ